jgi:hypothetical protein
VAQDLRVPRSLAGHPRPARWLVAACAAALLATFVAPGAARAAPSARSAIAPPLGGVNVIGLFDGSTLRYADRDIAAARSLGANVVRAELKWSALEPRRAGEIDPRALAFTDRLINDAAAAGVRVIFTVDSTPCWASSAPAPLLGRCRAGASTAANSWPPTATAPYAAVTSFLAARYGTRLAGIEIWNEPDHSNELYFAGPRKVERYAALLRAAYTAIKQANPAVVVLGGSLVGANGLFLRALYREGIKGYYDGLAVHFYSLELASLRAFHEVQLANGDSTPLWLDEFGWSSCYPTKRLQEEQPCVTPQVQAQNLSDIVRSVSRTPYVAAEVVYNLQNSGSESFGLLASNGRPKPAFAALRRALASPFSSAHRVTLSLRRRRSHVVAAGAGPVGDYIQLEVFRKRVLRYRVLFTLNRFNRYSITLPAALGTRGLQVRVFQYWTGLGRGAMKGI